MSSEIPLLARGSRGAQSLYATACSVHNTGPQCILQRKTATALSLSNQGSFKCSQLWEDSAYLAAVLIAAETCRNSHLLLAIHTILRACLIVDAQCCRIHLGMKLGVCQHQPCTSKESKWLLNGSHTHVVFECTILDFVR